MREFDLVQGFEEGSMGNTKDELVVIWQATQNMLWLNNERVNGKFEEKQKGRWTTGTWQKAKQEK